MSGVLDSRLLELVPEEGIDRAELTRLVVETFATSERTARSHIGGAVRVCRRMVDGKPERLALLVEKTRQRKDVYPDATRGGPFRWLTRAPRYAATYAAE